MTAPAVKFLEEHRKGELAAELSAAIQEVTTAALEHEKKGHVTLKIEIAGDGMAVFVTDTITKKVPEADRATAIMFADADGNLSKKMPGQLSIRTADRERQDENEEGVHAELVSATIDGQVVDLRTGEVTG